MAEYEIKGTGTKTNRKRKKTYYAKNEDEARRKAEADDTMVEEITRLPDPPPDPPTEKQLAYAQKLGLYVPPDATKMDVSSLLDMKISGDKPATKRHIGFAKYFDIDLINGDERFIGKKALFNLIFHTLCEPSREKDLVKWFAFRIYRHLVEGEYENIQIKTLDHEILDSVATQLYQDEAIIKSIRRYSGEKLIWFGDFTGKNGQVYNGASKRTAAYKTVSALLRAETGLPERRAVNHRQENSKRDYTPATSEEVKEVWLKVIVFIAVCVLFFWVKEFFF